MQSLDFTEKLVEKGKRESTDALLKKLKVRPVSITGSQRIWNTDDRRSIKR